MLMLSILISLAQATADSKSFLVVNPLLPTIAILADGIISFTEIDDFVKMRVWDANLRGYKIYTNRWGVMAQVDYTQSSLIWKSTHVGCKIGPRLSLQRSGFEGWSLSTYGLVGFTTSSASRYPLSRWAVVGAGTELGRSFVWNRLVLDLGLGFYTTKNLLYRASAEAFQDYDLPEPSTLPSIHIGMGYAF
tara:strand:+ start:291 stop:863 length:573 start_codon:yes stop_codon:yes gene_type:complete